MAEIKRNSYSPTLPARRTLGTEEEMQDFLVWLDAEHRRIALATTNQGYYEVRHGPPNKLRVGMVEYADGTDWNPDGVNGEGLYVYKTTGWTFIA